MSKQAVDFLRASTENALREEGAGKLLMETLDRLRKREYDDQDFYGQVFERFPLDIYDAWAFARMRAALGEADVITCVVRVGCEPHSDHCVKENNAALSELPSPFTATFVPARGRGAENDGSVQWSEPIAALAHDPRKPGGVADIRWMVPPGYLPLEVGYTDFATTFFHVFFRHGVARWPYGHEDMRLYFSKSRLGRLIHNSVPWPDGRPLPDSVRDIDEAEGRTR